MRNIHICLVSAQPLINILPALAPSLQPDLVYLLTSKQQVSNADHQSQVLKELGIATEAKHFDDAYDLEAIQALVEDILQQHPDDQLMLNATGGTKPMSIAAYESFYFADAADNERPVFYFQDDHVIWLHPQNREPLHLEQTLTLRQFLRAHGLQVTDENSKKVPQRLAELAASWARRAEKHRTLYGTLNYLAAKAANTLKTDCSSQISSNRDFDNLIYELEQKQLLSYNPKNRLMTFPDEEARFFVNGGWLEEHLFSVLTELQQDYPEKISAVSRSISVEFINPTPRQQQRQVRNELDVIAIVNHQMWVFECKTKKLNSRNQQGENDAQGMIYKLAGMMKSLGGLRTTGCVISFDKISDYDKSRAELFDIRTIDGANLKNLKSLLSGMLRLKQSD